MSEQENDVIEDDGQNEGVGADSVDQSMKAACEDGEDSVAGNDSLAHRGVVNSSINSTMAGSDDGDDAAQAQVGQVGGVDDNSGPSEVPALDSNVAAEDGNVPEGDVDDEAEAEENCGMDRKVPISMPPMRPTGVMDPLEHAGKSSDSGVDAAVAALHPPGQVPAAGFPVEGPVAPVMHAARAMHTEEEEDVEDGDDDEDEEGEGTSGGGGGAGERTGAGQDARPEGLPMGTGPMMHGVMAKPPAGDSSGSSPAGGEGRASGAGLASSSIPGEGGFIDGPPSTPAHGAPGSAASASDTPGSTATPGSDGKGKRPPGRPKGAKDSRPRTRRRKAEITAIRNATTAGLPVSGMGMAGMGFGHPAMFSPHHLGGHDMALQGMHGMDPMGYGRPGGFPAGLRGMWAGDPSGLGGDLGGGGPGGHHPLSYKSIADPSGRGLAGPGGDVWSRGPMGHHPAAAQGFDPSQGFMGGMYGGGGMDPYGFAGRGGGVYGAEAHYDASGRYAAAAAAVGQPYGMSPMMGMAGPGAGGMSQLKQNSSMAAAAAAAAGGAQGMMGRAQPGYGQLMRMEDGGDQGQDQQ